jgi:hypothetical protein
MGRTSGRLAGPQLNPSPTDRPALLVGRVASSMVAAVNTMAERAWTVPGAPAGPVWPGSGSDAASAGPERRNTGTHGRLGAGSRKSTYSRALLLIVSAVFCMVRAGSWTVTGSVMPRTSTADRACLGAREGGVGRGDGVLPTHGRAGPCCGYPLHGPRRALERAVLQEARLPGLGARTADAGHAGDPRAGGPARLRSRPCKAASRSVGSRRSTSVRRSSSSPWSPTRTSTGLPPSSSASGTPVSKQSISGTS